MWNHALWTGQLLTALLEEQGETIAAVRVAAREHPWHASLLVPLIKAYVTLHSMFGPGFS